MNTARRPYGTIGQPVRAITNAYHMDWPQGFVHHYDVCKSTLVSTQSPSPKSNDATLFEAILPEWDTKPDFRIGSTKCTEVVMRMQNENSHLFNPPAAFDGKKNLYSTVRYSFSSQEFTLSWDKNGRSRMPKNVKVRVVHVQEVNFGLLKKLLAGELKEKEYVADSGSSISMNMLNVFVQATPRMTVSKIHTAKSFYTPVRKHTSPAIQPLELWRGYFQSVRPTFDRIMVNVDVTIGVVVPKDNLERICATFLKENNTRRLTQLGESEFQRLRHFLKGMKIEIDLPKHAGKRPKPIQDLVRNVGERVFDKGDTKIRVDEYFSQSYRKVIRPGTLGIKTKDGSMFPIDVCHTVEQLFKNRASPEVVRESLAIFAKNPDERRKEIEAGWQQLSYTTSQFLVGAGIQVSSRLEQVNGRLLPSPEIVFGSGSMTLRRAGVWDVMRKKLKKPASVNSWTIVNFSNCNQELLRQFMSGLHRAMQDLGMTISNPAGLHSADPGSHVEQVLMEAHRESNARLIVVVLPESAEDIHRRVKRYGDISRGVITQCIKWSRNLETNARNGKSNQYHNNVILKINAKLGGTNFTPISPALKPLFKMRTMVVGADVSHPGPGSLLPSIASLVGSYDENACRYAASISVQDSRTEIIQDMNEMLTKVLRAFYIRNEKKLPGHIIIYRDGVSEGEFPIVATQEVGEMREAIKSAYGPNHQGWPILTFIVVGKRHHFRFFPASNDGVDMSGNRNLHAGFVLDRDIVHPTYNDFYLQSQAGLKGTSRPSHYTVLINGARMPPDELQQLSYTLCHCYARSTRSVKVPAPVYYADLVCRRAKYHFDEEANETMSIRSADSTAHTDFYRAHFQKIHSELENEMYFV